MNAFLNWDYIACEWKKHFDLVPVLYPARRDLLPIWLRPNQFVLKAAVAENGSIRRAAIMTISIIAFSPSHFFKLETTSATSPFA